MAKYLKGCTNCKMDCKEGLQDMKNSPHEFLGKMLKDYWCEEFQYLFYEVVG